MDKLFTVMLPGPSRGMAKCIVSAAMASSTESPGLSCSNDFHGLVLHLKKLFILWDLSMIYFGHIVFPPSNAPRSPPSLYPNFMFLLCLKQQGKPNPVKNRDSGLRGQLLLCTCPRVHLIDLLSFHGKPSIFPLQTAVNYK